MPAQARPTLTLDHGALSRPGIENRLGYCGYVWDRWLQVDHVRHRVYEPYHGRWYQPDPIGFAGGRNWFEYCGGSPGMGRDSMGLDWWGELVDGAKELIDPTAPSTTQGGSPEPSNGGELDPTARAAACERVKRIEAAMAARCGRSAGIANNTNGMLPNKAWTAGVPLGAAGIQHERLVTEWEQYRIGKGVRLGGTGTSNPRVLDYGPRLHGRFWRILGRVTLGFALVVIADDVYIAVKASRAADGDKATRHGLAAGFGVGSLIAPFVMPLGPAIGGAAVAGAGGAVILAAAIAVYLAVDAADALDQSVRDNLTDAQNSAVNGECHLLQRMLVAAKKQCGGSSVNYTVNGKPTGGSSGGSCSGQ